METPKNGMLVHKVYYLPTDGLIIAMILKAA